MRRRFLYNAHASGFAGQLTVPFLKTLDSSATSALAVTGGYSTSRVENRSIEGIVSVGAAYSTATGSYIAEDKRWETLVTATVERLNLMDQVIANKIIARLVARYPEDGGEPTIIPLGSCFEGLKIAGNPVEVDLDDDAFTSMGAFSQVKKGLQSDKALQERLGVSKASKESVSKTDLMVCSLVKSVSMKSRQTLEAAPTQGSIYVPGFGTVYLAEFVMGPKMRRLTMLRVELGSPVRGEMSFGDVYSNGEPWPP
jgi:hypothetical protein